MPRTRTPYDIQFGYSSTSRDFILAKDENGAIQFKRGFIQELVDQQRTDTFSYQHRDPRVDLPASFERFTLGAGFEDAPDIGELGFSGYNYTKYADCSWGSRAYMQAASNSGGTSLPEDPSVVVSTGFGVYAVGTRYVRKWSGVGGSWSTVLDAGASASLTDIKEFTNTTDSYLVVGARNTGYYYSWDGTNFFLSEAPGTAPSHRADSNNNANATTITLTEPAGAAQNDILIAALESVSEWMIPASADWKQVAIVANGSNYLSVYWCRRGGSAPSLVFNTSTGGTSRQIEAGCSAIQNCVLTGSPIDVFSTATSTTTTNHVLSSITTTGGNRFVVGFVGIGASTAITEPGSTTEEYDSTAGATVSIESFDFAQASAGATGTKTATTAGNQSASLVMLALKPKYTGANDVVRWATRGQSSGASLLWGVDSRGCIRSCTDPTVPASWSTSDAIQMGQGSPDIIGLEVLDNVFYLVHTKGIEAYDGTTVTTVFRSPFANAPTMVARPVIGADLKMYLTFGSAILRFDPTDNSVEKVWPRGPQAGNTVLNGTIVGMAPSERYLYFALYNSAGDTYIMKLDPFQPVSVASETIYPVHSIIYRGVLVTKSLSYFTGGSTEFNATNPHLVINDNANDSISYFIMPRPGLRPEDDSNYLFATSGDTGDIYGSYVTFGAQGFSKWLTRGDIEGVTTTLRTITLQYQVPGGSATTVTTANTNLSGRTTAVISSPVAFSTVREVVLLTNGSTSASTPILKGSVLHAAPNAPRDAGFSFIALLKDKQETNHGGATRYKAAELESYLFAGINQVGTLRDLRGTSWTVKVLDAETVAVKYGADGELETHVKVTVAQLTS